MDQANALDISRCLLSWLLHASLSSTVVMSDELRVKRGSDAMFDSLSAGLLKRPIFRPNAEKKSLTCEGGPLKIV